jgi:hypothetical protein
MNRKEKHTKAPGVLGAVVEAEVAAGLARLGIQSREELYAKAELYPSTEDEPACYELVAPPFVARARAFELLTCIAHDGLTEPVESVDATIAELRIVLQNAATEPCENVTRWPKRAA